MSAPALIRSVASMVLTVLLSSASAQSISSWVIGASGDPWAQVVDRWIALDDTSRSGSVMPQRLIPGHTVTRELLRSGIAATQRNLFGYRWSFHKGPLQLEADTLEVGWHPRMWQRGGVNAIASPVMRGLVDGDELAAGFTHKARVDGRLNAVSFFTLDLGVPVPVDSVVFFPPQSGLTSDNQRQRELFPRAYEVSRTNTPVEWLIFEDEDTSTGSVGYHPLDEILGTTFANNNSIVSLSPELRFTRFLRFKFGEVTTTTMLAEIQVFGRGFPQEARYFSEPHSFGQPVSLGQVTWKFTKFRQTPSGEVVEDPTAPVELVLRTRAGTDPEPRTYFIYDELGRDLEVDKDTYFAAPRVVERFSVGVTGFRAKRGDDTENWNNWSTPYEQSGRQVRSSDGGQYLQFRFEILSEDPLAFGVLDSIAFEVSPLLADTVVAEISLDGALSGNGGRVEVPLGVDTLFVYDIRTVAGRRAGAGYDGIELDVPAAARFVDLEIDGELAREGDQFTVETGAGVLRLLLPAPVQRDATFRVRFRSAIFQSSVFLGGRIFNRDPAVARLPQSIEGGDARADVDSDGIQVISGGVRFRALGDLHLSSPVVTPNGDGANDEVAIDFDLYGVDGVGLKVTVLDLSGRRVASILDVQATSGPYAPLWAGVDDAGRLVPPGLYVIRVELEVDEGILTTFEPVAVAF